MRYFRNICKLLRVNIFRKKSRNSTRRKHKIEKWMTNEPLIKIVEKNKLYVKWKTTPINLEKYEEIKKQFKECEKNVIKLIKELNNSILIEFLQHIEQTLRKHGVQIAKR